MKSKETIQAEIKKLKERLQDCIERQMFYTANDVKIEITCLEWVLESGICMAVDNHLMVVQTTDNMYAVRPMTWAGIWDRDGRLEKGCNSLAFFAKQDDALLFVIAKEEEMKAEESNHA